MPARQSRRGASAVAASTVPQAKAALLAMLRARPALNEVAVTWAGPTENEDVRDQMIFFDGPVLRQPEWVVLGADKLDERYTLTLHVETYTPGDDPDVAEQRCWALIDEIEQAVRDDDTLGGLLIGEGVTFGEQEVAAVPANNDWKAVGVVPLDCHARI